MKHSFSRLFGLNDKNEDNEMEQAMAVEEDLSIAEKEEVHQLPVDEIVPNRFQPRTVFQDERIDELAQTIKTHGIIQPIVVRMRDDKYEIIAGERRWRAVKKLGWQSIPAVIKEFNDSQTASVALIENLQREGLTAIEEAAAYARLLELHHLTQESLAQRLGKGQSTIANKLRLLNLPDAVQEALLNRSISERHARALIALKDPVQQEKLLERIITNDLNVKQTEEAVKKLKEGKTEKKKPIRKGVSKDMRLAMNTIRKSVDMVVQTGMHIDTSEEEHDEYYQFTIRIPKS
ncbi:chromosome partitioning protein, ParB family [Evansella caseinilytica]|uniref:Chromosome partitioning protein, ParB family n=1 Tax=Evansella caseinilytica TaxID=1503961 RepID=A0A1H3URY9_9BACI|nr:nucleoid occlusion protein [Evansella caseinilytica]SDZ65154.1 chromosome partitioning protein, ParB family [Evansella caseinilytica]